MILLFHSLFKKSFRRYLLFADAMIDELSPNRTNKIDAAAQKELCLARDVGDNFTDVYPAVLVYLVFVYFRPSYVMPNFCFFDDIGDAVTKDDVVRCLVAAYEADIVSTLFHFMV